jgi:spore coat polysaccharide biosynthesis predicted glycosyltransferase SpsG
MNPKILCISGSFGLGHVTRDLGIVREMRRISLILLKSYEKEPSA